MKIVCLASLLLTAQASVPMKGVDGTFVHDKKTNTWVPTTKTWEDMVTCPDLGLDDSCLTPKSKCNMRHNVDKTGKGPKYLFDAGEECCCGALPEVGDDECNPKECADWDCPKWCHCFETYPNIMEVFEGANPNAANRAIRELCPSDNSECDCTEKKEPSSDGMCTYKYSVPKDSSIAEQPSLPIDLSPPNAGNIGPPFKLPVAGNCWYWLDARSSYPSHKPECKGGAWLKDLWSSNAIESPYYPGNKFSADPAGCMGRGASIASWCKLESTDRLVSAHCSV